MTFNGKWKRRCQKRLRACTNSSYYDVVSSSHIIKEEIESLQYKCYSTSISKFVIYVEDFTLMESVKLDKPITSTTFKDPTTPIPTLTL